MPGENIYDWSTTAASNGSADSSINWQEGQARASVNNSARSMLAAHAKQRDLLNGSIVTTGSPNDQAFTSGMGFIGTIPTGFVARLQIGIGLTNTGPTTLNMDSIGPVAIKTTTATDIAAGALFDSTYAEFIYNGTNWILVANFQAAGAPDGLSNIRVFTASGTYPTTTNIVKVLVMCKGGGGGGAGGGGGSLPSLFGGGGGEGATSYKLTTSDALSAQTVTIGAGGTGSSAVSGGVGGTSSIGTIVTAPGGNGGINPDGFASGGAGGAGGTNDWGEPGCPGQSGVFVIGVVVQIATTGGGRGGGTGRGAGVANSGGGGAGSDNPSSAGSGGSGIIVCQEFGTI